MTQNLRLGSNDKKVILTSGDSDVSNSFELSQGIKEDTGIFIDNDKLKIQIKISANKEYGVYYNWITSTAGTGNLDCITETVVNSSVCPKGWQLPSKQIATELLNKYSRSSIQSEPDNFKLGGEYSYSLVGENRDMHYWTSTCHIYANYAMGPNPYNFPDCNVSIGWSVVTCGNMWQGKPVRCVSK